MILNTFSLVCNSNVHIASILQVRSMLWLPRSRFIGIQVLYPKRRFWLTKIEFVYCGKFTSYRVSFQNLTKWINNYDTHNHINTGTVFNNLKKDNNFVHTKNT